MMTDAHTDQPLSDVIRFILDGENGKDAQEPSADTVREITFLVEELGLSADGARRRHIRARRSAFATEVPKAPRGLYHRPPPGVSHLITSLLEYRMIPLYDLKKIHDRYPPDEWNRVAWLLTALGIPAEEARRKYVRQRKVTAQNIASAA